MLVSTQASVGIVSSVTLLQLAGMTSNFVIVALAWLMCIGGMLAATMHLGRPWLAFRGILGWRHSWLSREAIAFGAYSGLLSIACATTWTDNEIATQLALFGSVLSGWVGVICSCLIYQFTRRVFWVRHRTMLKFCGTTIVLGSAAALLQFAMAKSSDRIVVTAMLVAVATVLKLSLERWVLLGRTSNNHGELTRELHSEDLHRLVVLRRLGAIVGGMLIPALVVLPIFSTANFAIFLAALSFAFLLTGELAERSLYFRAVIPWTMPGGIQ